MRESEARSAEDAKEVIALGAPRLGLHVSTLLCALWCVLWGDL